MHACLGADNVVPGLGSIGFNTTFPASGVLTPERNLADWLMQQGQIGDEFFSCSWADMLKNLTGAKLSFHWLLTEADGEADGATNRPHAYGPSDRECRDLEEDHTHWSPGWTRLLVWAHPHTQGRSAHVRFVWREAGQRVAHREVKFEGVGSTSEKMPLATISGPYQDPANGASWFDVTINTQGRVVYCTVDQTLAVKTPNDRATSCTSSSSSSSCASDTALNDLAMLAHQRKVCFCTRCWTLLTE